eukprot:TRINITY_DN26676_c0_g1_i1.p1 TRINITY_DN26676_c0_g1~~TRINITY_DN26676_c0_g1_i1.p1  ORF type:complete len:294 (-),score=33.58 TRINITY_DN26676_c0_g1_i1:43-924(-)
MEPIEERITISFNGLKHHVRRNQLTLENLWLLCRVKVGTKLYLRDMNGNVEFESQSLFPGARHGVEYNVELGGHKGAVHGILKSDVRLHYNCLEGEGSRSELKLIDLSGNGNDASLYGPATINGGVLSTSGGSYASCPCSDSICGLSCFSVEAWVEPTSWSNTSGNGGMILTLVGQYYLEVKNGGKVSVYCYGVTPEGYHDSSSSIALNRVSHIAFTYDGSKMSIYINGNLDVSVPAKGKPRDDRTHKLVLGSWTSGYTFTGRIFVARIYGHALRKEEIMGNYLSEKTLLKTL